MKKITGWILVLLVTLLCTAVLADVAIDSRTRTFVILCRTLRIQTETAC